MNDDHAMSSSVISVQGLSKAYRIGSREPAPDTLVGALKASLRSPFRNLRDLRRLDTLSHDADSENVLWALQDVTFEVSEGEVVGHHRPQRRRQEHAAEDPAPDHRADRRARSTSAAGSAACSRSAPASTRS